MDHSTGPALSAHQFIFCSFFIKILCLISCSIICWLTVSLWLHVKYTVLYCILSLQSAGLGKLRPNVLLMGFKSDWQTAPMQAVADYFAIIQYVSVMTQLCFLFGTCVRAL